MQETSLLAWSLLLAVVACARSLKISSPDTLGSNASIYEAAVFVENISCADYTEDDAAAWAGYQSSLTRAVHQLLGNSSRSLRVLIASPVQNSWDAVHNFEDNWRKLKSSGSGDRFHFALFHYDDSNKLWEERQWYSDPSGPVVLRHVGLGCKPSFWFKIDPQMASNYDYVWLLDGDMRFDLFSWGLYRSFLTSLEPLVSQPSIVPWTSGKRSTLIPALRMATSSSGKFSIAREVGRSEVQAPVLSTKLWRAFHARLSTADLSVDHHLDRFWDFGAVLSNLECGRVGVLLVNAVPLRHMNYHDLWKRHICKKGCGAKGANCRGVGSWELQLLREGLTGYCDFSNDSLYVSACAGQLPCEGESWGSQRHWVDRGRGEVAVLERPGASCPGCCRGS